MGRLFSVGNHTTKWCLMACFLSCLATYAFGYSAKDTFQNTSQNPALFVCHRLLCCCVRVCKRNKKKLNLSSAVWRKKETGWPLLSHLVDLITIILEKDSCNMEYRLNAIFLPLFYVAQFIQNRVLYN
ncbi:hypothetical protein BDB00DRAFT_370954 [Zychaea mexicana]|uniref:uncharacterized protein n=1 Tax=Zychaea mexicana TaxID=64656 RepID=UPI0022FECE9D|nr:uncharacterized protein BDB00DRAFT_370954 [Zychaea mexicana]KAI9493408.1 hypothetical protein BDB00DRAFT_370954 [Zychaea mexicana]